MFNQKEREGKRERERNGVGFKVKIVLYVAPETEQGYNSKSTAWNAANFARIAPDDLTIRGSS